MQQQSAGRIGCVRRAVGPRRRGVWSHRNLLTAEGTRTAGERGQTQRSSSGLSRGKCGRADRSTKPRIQHTRGSRSGDDQRTERETTETEQDRKPDCGLRKWHSRTTAGDNAEQAARKRRRQRRHVRMSKDTRVVSMRGAAVIRPKAHWERQSTTGRRRCARSSALSRVAGTGIPAVVSFGLERLTGTTSTQDPC